MYETIASARDSNTQPSTFGANALSDCAYRYCHFYFSKTLESVFLLNLSINLTDFFREIKARFYNYSVLN